MEKQTFKVGDRVYVARYGWGFVECVKSKKCSVKFDDGGQVISVPNRLISFEKYFLQTLLEKKLCDYSAYIGKCGKFSGENTEEWVVGRLERYEPDEDGNFFKCKGVVNWYEYFEPFTDEQIKILRLE